MEKALIITIAVTAALVGCSDAGKGEDVKSVDWYKEHTAERAAKIKECNNNPGELKLTPNCINAKKAQSSITWSSREAIDAKPLTSEDLKQ